MPIVAPVPTSAVAETTISASSENRSSPCCDFRFLTARRRVLRSVAGVYRRSPMHESFTSPPCGESAAERPPGGDLAYRSPSASAPWLASPKIGNPNTPYAATTTQNATPPAVENAVTAGSA